MIGTFVAHVHRTTVWFTVCCSPKHIMVGRCFEVASTWPENKCFKMAKLTDYRQRCFEIVDYMGQWRSQWRSKRFINLLFWSQSSLYLVPCSVWVNGAVTWKQKLDMSACLQFASKIQLCISSCRIQYTFFPVIIHIKLTVSTPNFPYFWSV